MGRNSRTIFARNISWNATADDFRNIPEFAQALDIKLPTDRETGRPRGFGFIEFATADECAKALANAQVVFDGREVILAQSQPRQGGGGGGYNQGGGFHQGNQGYNNNNFNRFD